MARAKAGKIFPGVVAATLAVGVAMAASDGRGQGAGQETVVRIVAQRFVYTPNEIVLHKGQPAVLEFTALDFTHDFSVPDLGLRADLTPGKVTAVRLTPDKAGTYDFLCDNFCGAGHEQMSGRIVVSD